MSSPVVEELERWEITHDKITKAWTVTDADGDTVCSRHSENDAIVLALFVAKMTRRPCRIVAG